RSSSLMTISSVSCSARHVRAVALPHRRTGRSVRSELLLDLLDLERLDDVLVFEIAVAVERDAALEALGDLFDVVLEALERVELAFPDHRVVAHEARVVAPANLALDDVAAGDDDPADLEDLPDLRLARELLDLRRRKEAFHRSADVVDRVVDDRVE